MKHSLQIRTCHFVNNILLFSECNGMLKTGKGTCTALAETYTIISHICIFSKFSPPPRISHVVLLHNRLHKRCIKSNIRLKLAHDSSSYTLHFSSEVKQFLESVIQGSFENSNPSRS